VTSKRRFFIKLSGVILAVIAFRLFAANPLPPHKYNLSEVRIVLERSLSAYETRHYDSVTVRGDGQAEYKTQERGKTQSDSFTLSSEEVRQILQGVYDAGFFDFNDYYVAKPLLKFGDDGTVHEGGTMENHQVHVIMTVQIADYVKSVEFVDYSLAPVELRQLVDDFKDAVGKYIPMEKSW